jgi:hypothetical protein
MLPLDLGANLDAEFRPYVWLLTVSHFQHSFNSMQFCFPRNLKTTMFHYQISSGVSSCHCYESCHICLLAALCVPLKKCLLAALVGLAAGQGAKGRVETAGRKLRFWPQLFCRTGQQGANLKKSQFPTKIIICCCAQKLPGPDRGWSQLLLPNNNQYHLGIPELIYPKHY